MCWAFSFLFDRFQWNVIIQSFIEESAFFFLIKTGDTVGLAWLMSEGKNDTSFVNVCYETRERSLYCVIMHGFFKLWIRKASSPNLFQTLWMQYSTKKTSWLYYGLTDIVPFQNWGLFFRGEFALATSRDPDNFWVKTRMRSNHTNAGISPNSHLLLCWLWC